MTETIKIERMSYGPDGIGHRKDGKTVFVSGVIAGDVAEVEITQEKSNFAHAWATKITQESPYRVSEPLDAACIACGGCSWAALTYENQLEFKRAHVVDALSRVGHMPYDDANAKVAPCVPSKREWGYRNKIELATFADSQGRFALGFHKQGTNDIVAVSSCPLANRYLQDAPKAITGALRYLSGNEDLGIYRVELRASLRTKSTEIALWTPPGYFPRSVVAHTLESAMKTTSIVRVLADSGKARKVKKLETLSGAGLWFEELNIKNNFRESNDSANTVKESISYAVSAPSFFQVNTAQAEKLVDLALNSLGDIHGAYVADLYSGVGTFSIPLALAKARVVAIEVAGSSTRDARKNVSHAGVDIDCICEDVGSVLPKLGHLDALLVDPPRAGLAKHVVDHISDAAPHTIIYISCDPQTLARDAALLIKRGYTLLSATPVDMFPQTYHVETVAVFTL